MTVQHGSKAAEECTEVTLQLIMPEKKMWRNTAVNIREDEGCEVTVQNMSEECIEVTLQLM